jgi:site-specific DNA-methyltransferase (cytosine-N4-specific)
LGFSSIGNDINPLSCLLSKVKAKPINIEKIKKIDIFLDNLLINYNKKSKIKLFSYKSIDHWFQKNVIRELSFIKNSINKIDDNDVQDILLIILSSIIVRVSNQESDTRYAAKNKKIKDAETLKIFIEKGKEVKKLYLDFYEKTKKSKIKVTILQLDSRNLSKIKNNSVDLIITSPPYANTYDYYLYHKHRKYWLDMDAKLAQINEIGSRHEFSSLKEDPQKWEDDIKECLLELKRIIKKNKNIFIIIGDSVIDNKLIKMDKMIEKLSKEVGLSIKEKTSSMLSKHSKMFNPGFGSKFKKREHLILLKK